MLSGDVRNEKNRELTGEGKEEEGWRGKGRGGVGRERERRGGGGGELPTVFLFPFHEIVLIFFPSQSVCLLCLASLAYTHLSRSRKMERFLRSFNSLSS